MAGGELPRIAPLAAHRHGQGRGVRRGRPRDAACGTVPSKSTATSDPPRIFFLDTPPPGRSRHGIAVDFRAGYGALAEDVPAPLRLAIKVIVARWFENRGDVAGSNLPPKPRLSPPKGALADRAVSTPPPVICQP